VGGYCGLGVLCMPPRDLPNTPICSAPSSHPTTTTTRMSWQAPGERGVDCAVDLIWQTLSSGGGGADGDAVGLLCGG